PGDAAHRAFDLGMTGMADQDDLPPLVGVALPLDMDFRHQRACCVDNRQPALPGQPLDFAGNTVRAEDRYRTRRYLVDFIYKASTLCAQTFDDMSVVHNFVPDIDRRAILVESA